MASERNIEVIDCVLERSWHRHDCELAKLHVCTCGWEDVEHHLIKALDDAEARVRREYEPVVEALREMVNHMMFCRGAGCLTCEEARELLREREEADGE